MYIGIHYLLELYGCDKKILQSKQKIEYILVKAARAGNATVLSKSFYKFGRYGGVTGVICIAESHITIHTWPEYHYAAVDIFTCGDKMNTLLIKSLICSALNPKKVKDKCVKRGCTKEIYCGGKSKRC